MSSKWLALRNSEVNLIWWKFPGVLDRIQCVLRDVDGNGGVTVEVPGGGQASGFYPASSVYDIVAVEPDDAMYSGNRPKLRRAIRDYIWNLGEQEMYQFTTDDVESLAKRTGAPSPWVEGTFLNVAGDIWTGRVVATSELLDPAPRVSSGLHNLACGLAFADQPEDLVMAALHRIWGPTVTALQLSGVQVRLKLYLLWHNEPLYKRTWYHPPSESINSRKPA